MWDYSDKLKDHFFNPRNVGKIKNADGLGEVGSLACGDALSLYLKLDEKKEKIIDAKFQTFGCGSAVASASALTELIIGLTLKEALKITNQDIADYLDGMPEEKMHCSVMGREALEAAIKNLLEGKSETVVLDASPIICTCFGVTEEKILRAISENNLTTIDQITYFTKAGGGCTKCHKDIQILLDKEKTKRLDLAPPPLPREKKFQRRLPLFEWSSQHTNRAHKDPRHHRI